MEKDRRFGFTCLRGKELREMCAGGWYAKRGSLAVVRQEGENEEIQNEDNEELKKAADNEEKNKEENDGGQAEFFIMKGFINHWQLQALRPSKLLVKEELLDVLFVE